MNQTHRSPHFCFLVVNGQRQPGGCLSQRFEILSRIGVQQVIGDGQAGIGAGKIRVDLDRFFEIGDRLLQGV